MDHSCQAGPAEPEGRARALAILQRHGAGPFAFQTLSHGLRYFFDGDDAFVAYVDTGRAWVAAGEPVAPPERLEPVARRFVEVAWAANRRPRFFGVEAGRLEGTPWRRTFIGEEPVWDPSGWPAILRSTRSLREQLRRARAKGVSTRILAPEELRAGGPLRDDLAALGERWLASRRMAPMGFLLQLDPFHRVDVRLYVLAEVGGRAVELLVASPVYARDGWVIEHVLRDPEAPNGTTELLVDGLMRHVAEAGSGHVSLGLAPLAGEVPAWLRVARRLGRFFYNFEGLHRFKAKLRPHHWVGVELVYPAGEGTLRPILDVLKAFATGGFLRFGLACVRHVRRSILWFLAVALVPWTVMLAVADRRWFPTLEVKWSWVAFDVVLILLMFTLLARWGRGPTRREPHDRADRRGWPLVRTLFVLTTVDAVLTLVQAVAHNVSRASTTLDWLLICASILAPAAAALFFGTCLVGRRVSSAPSAGRPAPG